MVVDMVSMVRGLLEQGVIGYQKIILFYTNFACSGLADR